MPPPSRNGSPAAVWGLGFDVSSFGSRVSGFESRVSGFGSWITGLEFGVSSSGLRGSFVESQVSCLGCRVSGFEIRVSGFGFRVLGLRFRVSGFGFRILGLKFEGLGFGFGVSGKHLLWQPRWQPRDSRGRHPWQIPFQITREASCSLIPPAIQIVKIKKILLANCLEGRSKTASFSDFPRFPLLRFSSTFREVNPGS